MQVRFVFDARSRTDVDAAFKAIAPAYSPRILLMLAATTALPSLATWGAGGAAALTLGWVVVAWFTLGSYSRNFARKMSLDLPPGCEASYEIRPAGLWIELGPTWTRYAWAAVSVARRAPSLVLELGVERALAVAPATAFESPAAMQAFADEVARRSSETAGPPAAPTRRSEDPAAVVRFVRRRSSEPLASALPQAVVGLVFLLAAWYAPQPFKALAGAIGFFACWLAMLPFWNRALRWFRPRVEETVEVAPEGFYASTAVSQSFLPLAAMQDFHRVDGRIDVYGPHLIWRSIPRDAFADRDAEQAFVDRVMRFADALDPEGEPVEE